jgi:hypothetical protein
MEAARIEVARLAAEASSESLPRASAGFSDGYCNAAAPVTSQVSPSDFKCYDAQKQDQFADLVRLQMEAQEAMKKRVGSKSAPQAGRGGEATPSTPG